MLVMADDVGIIELPNKIWIIARRMGPGVKIGEYIPYSLLDLLYNIGE